MSRPPQKADYRLLAKVAKLYYEQGLRQREIADRLHLSRPKVSRLINQAHDEGIVQIIIIPRPGNYHELEDEVEEKFNLHEVIITEVNPVDTQEIVSEKIGMTAADYLLRTLQDKDVLGVSWGTTISAMVNALQPTVAKKTQIVQLIGGLGPPEAEAHANILCQRMSQILRSKLTLISAPGIVDTQEIRQIFLSDRYVQAAFDLFSSIDVAYVGIGAPTPNSVIMRDGSIITQKELEYLKALGAVGDIALRFFDAEGQLVRSTIDERVIGISLEEIQQIERVVGIAGGPQKPEVIRGALKGGWVNVLVTDQITAEQLLGVEEPSHESDSIEAEPA